MAQKYEQNTYRSVQMSKGVFVEISVREDALKKLGLTAGQFFAVAKPCARLYAETFHNLCSPVRDDAKT